MAVLFLASVLAPSTGAQSLSDVKNRIESSSDETPISAEDYYANLNPKEHGAFAHLKITKTEFSKFETELYVARSLGPEVYLQETYGPLQFELQQYAKAVQIYGIGQPNELWKQGNGNDCAIYLSVASEKLPDLFGNRSADISWFIQDALNQSARRAKLRDLATIAEVNGDEEKATRLRKIASAILSRKELFAAHVLMIENSRSTTNVTLIEEKKDQLLTLCNAEQYKPIKVVPISPR